MNIFMSSTASSGSLTPIMTSILTRKTWHDTMTKVNKHAITLTSDILSVLASCHVNTNGGEVRTISAG